MKKILWNNDWEFSKTNENVPSVKGDVVGEWEAINIPHTWNEVDGQDGGNDYFRGDCYYVKELKASELSNGKHTYLEFEGVNSSATVYVNGKSAGVHHGGYSTWRVNITELLEDENIITVVVNNAANEFVYPQMADFTFYGGIYRSVSLICVEDCHFDLDYYGSPSIMVTPKIEGNNANVEVEVFLTGENSQNQLKYSLIDNGKVIAEKEILATETKVEFLVENVHLWNGRKDPYLYSAKVELIKDSKVIDERNTKFGCRTFEICPDKGFILNGKEYPLRGVSRHQDWKGIGNALDKKNHEIDMDLICEVGATTIRLAHYQHDQYFYDLCDEKGMIIWAEIPYISRHMPTGLENTVSQMKELIAQNYNHASIVVWGLSNEISIASADESLLNNHNVLNDICHEMDKTRLTTIAVVSPCSINDPYVQIPDVVSYNHYFGWYGGSHVEYGDWFDNFHKTFPKLPIGISEYGCEALNWHTSNPEPGDYTEEYQAEYHESLINQIADRPYLWATHVWNMFDFAADARDEGGSQGMNNKGLVTFDRTYKKDSFYAYKAWLAETPFVHICGKRYVDRVEDVTKITVYSNLPEVELFINGKSFAKQKGERFFYFNIPNVSESVIVAKTLECSDESRIKKVDVFNEEYKMKETNDVINWFEIDEPAGYLSINSKISEISKSDGGKAFMGNMIVKIAPNMADTLASQDKGALDMMGNMTVKRIVSLIGGMSNIEVTKELMLDINKELNKIKK